MKCQLILVLSIIVVVTKSASISDPVKDQDEGKEKAMLSLEKLGLAQTDNKEAPFAPSNQSESQVNRGRRDEVSDYEGWEKKRRR